MKEIKVGEYVRLKNGIILKYGEKSSTIIENNIYTDYSGEYEWSSEVVKHSSNIIDLIEEGDYVNGYIVRRAYLDGETHYLKLGEQITGNRTYNDNIKSICTKEQFEQSSYRLEE